MLTRHNKRKLSEGKHLPDLLIVDGGKGQLGVALSVKDELNLDFNIISLVKDDKHTTKALINEEGDEISVNKIYSLFSPRFKMKGTVTRLLVTELKEGKGHTQAL